MAGYRVISSDNHIMEPPDLWAKRIEAKYRDRRPQLVTMEGGQAWVCEGNEGNSPGQGSQPGVRFESQEELARIDFFENVRPGGYIPDDHIKDMDTDGIDVSIIYPSAGLVMYGRVPDGDLLSAVFRAYNDFVGEFCQPYPKRLGGIAMINVDDVKLAVNELRRCRAMGFVGGMITVYPPEGRRYDSPEYDPLWATAQDLEMPLSLHAATNRWGSGEAFQLKETARLAHLCNMDMGVRMSLADMIYSGVFERYPKLQIGAVEHELSWAPHFLNRLDYNYLERPAGWEGYRYKENMLPSGLLPSQRIPRLPGRRPGHPAASHHRGRLAPVGLGLPPPRVHLPQKPGNPRRDPGRLYRGRKSKDRRRERGPGISDVKGRQAAVPE